MNSYDRLIQLGIDTKDIPDNEDDRYLMIRHIGFKNRENGYKEWKEQLDSKSLDLEIHKCDYGCGNVAYFYFKSADKWCCNSNFRKCEGHRAEMSRKAQLRNYDSPLNKLRRSLKAGKEKCVVCGRTAKYLIANHIPCCTKYKKDCPEYVHPQQERMLDYYNNTPGAREKARAKLRECQNRPIVKAKKKVKMILLHNKKNDCIPCVEFQENYNKGLLKRNEKTLERQIKYLESKGFNTYDIPTDNKERTALVNRVKSKYRYRSTLGSNVIINTKISGGI